MLNHGDPVGNAGGSTRFNGIRRGVPRISPRLLSKQLEELEAHGLVEQVEDPARRAIGDLRTRAAREVEPIPAALDEWANRTTDAEDQPCWLEPKFVMWNVRRAIDTQALPARRVVLKFSYQGLADGPRVY